MTAKEHNKLLSIFMLVHGGLQIFGVIIMLLIYGGIGTAMIANARRDEEQMIGGVFIGVILVVAFISLFFVIPQFVGGWEVVKRENERTHLGNYCQLPLFA